MPIAKVHRISAAAPDDMSGIEAAIAAGRIDPNGVIAVLAKTEGNGLRQRFLARARHARVEPAVPAPSAAGGGGAHLPGDVGRHRRRHGAALDRVRARGRRRRGRRPALAIGRAHTPALPFEHLGRLAQVEQVAAGVRAAMADAGIDDPADVHFVQVKCPLLTAQRVARRGPARRRRRDPGHAQVDGPVAGGERARRRGRARRDRARDSADADIGAHWSLWSGRASASAGIELLNHEIVVLGMSPSGRARSPSTMR